MSDLTRRTRTVSVFLLQEGEELGDEALVERAEIRDGINCRGIREQPHKYAEVGVGYGLRNVEALLA